jgi:hypothetical protein
VTLDTLVGSLALTVGGTVTLAAGYLVVRSPFLGGPALDPPVLIGALGVFLAGFFVASWGLVRAAGVGARL